MLTGKVALVTGAGRGIGRTIARTLAKNGATVIVNYNGSKESAEAVVAEIVQDGGSAEAMQCNVADFASSETFAKAVLEKYKKVDILVNNAGVTRDNLIMRMSEADYDAVLDTNLKGAFNMIRHLARGMVKQRSGKIINITSVSGVLGNAGQSNYAASKAGVIGLTKALAKELARKGVTVNAIAPGFIETDMTAALSDDQKAHAQERIAAGRLGQPEDVAALAAFLASDEAAYITGQVICVDGGLSL